jgi:hypothetical protein
MIITSKENKHRKNPSPTDASANLKEIQAKIETTRPLTPFIVKMQKEEDKL